MNSNGDRLDRIESLLDEVSNITRSNARAIETLTLETQDLKRSQENLNRRFDNFLSEIAQDRATAYQRLTLLENNQSRLIDIMRVINRKIIEQNAG